MKQVIILVMFFLFGTNIIVSQQKKSSAADTLVVAFYNQENLFDAVDDPQKEDADFLPTSKKEWTEERFDKKMANMSKVIRSMNDNKGPDIIGVCEVENQAVLETMVEKYLSDLNYQIVYKESPDNRGIDVGLLFRKNIFKLASMHADTVELPDKYPTRLILNANLVTPNDDTLHVFVNHWPSRRGGSDASEISRITAAKVLRNEVESLFAASNKSLFLAMGDFNDEPTNISIKDTLNALPLSCDDIDKSKSSIPHLYNLAYGKKIHGEGSYKYQSEWDMLDQIIVSENLLMNESLHYVCPSFEIYKPDFIVTHSGKYEGAPFPTYGGNRYLGGYSDHFPVLAKFVLKKKK